MLFIISRLQMMNTMSAKARAENGKAEIRILFAHCLVSPNAHVKFARTREENVTRVILLSHLTLVCGRPNVILQMIQFVIREPMD